MQLFLKRILTSIVFLIASNSIAQQSINTPSNSQNELILTKKDVNASPWVILGGIARHSCRDCGFRESNPGMALQWQSPWFEEFSGLKNSRLTTGAYINSNNRNSVYAGAQWLPMEYGVMKLGLQAVLITGYKEAAVAPVLLPMVSIETPHVGVDMYVVPKLAKVSAAVFATLKFRF